MRLVTKGSWFDSWLYNVMQCTWTSFSLTFASALKLYNMADGKGNDGCVVRKVMMELTSSYTWIWLIHLRYWLVETWLWFISNACISRGSIWLFAFFTVLLISDENGSYYWHIKSGTIQREAPVASPVDVHSPKDVTSSSSVSVMKFLLIFSDSLSNYYSNLFIYLHSRHFFTAFECWCWINRNGIWPVKPCCSNLWSFHLGLLYVKALRFV